MERETTLAGKSWKIRSFQAEDLQGFAALAEISAASPQASQFSAEDYQGIACMRGGVLLLTGDFAAAVGAVGEAVRLDPKNAIFRSVTRSSP